MQESKILNTTGYQLFSADMYKTEGCFAGAVLYG